MTTISSVRASPAHLREVDQAELDRVDLRSSPDWKTVPLQALKALERRASVSGNPVLPPVDRELIKMASARDFEEELCAAMQDLYTKILAYDNTKVEERSQQIEEAIEKRLSDVYDKAALDEGSSFWTFVEATYNFMNEMFGMIPASAAAGLPGGAATLGIMQCVVHFFGALVLVRSAYAEYQRRTIDIGIQQHTSTVININAVVKRLSDQNRKMMDALEKLMQNVISSREIADELKRRMMQGLTRHS